MTVPFREISSWHTSNHTVNHMAVWAGLPQDLFERETRISFRIITNSRYIKYCKKKKKKNQIFPYVNFRSYIATTDLHYYFVLPRVLDLKILHQRVLKSRDLITTGLKFRGLASRGIKSRGLTYKGPTFRSLTSGGLTVRGFSVTGFRSRSLT